MKKLLFATGIVLSGSPLFALTCPFSGTCVDNANYKTVGAGTCPSGSYTVSGLPLTITGTGTDSKGTFSYGSCNG